MTCCVRTAIVASLASLVLSAGAAANITSPRSPVTKQLSGVPCSVTAIFSMRSDTRTMAYGGGVSCVGGIGEKTLDVVPQVFNVVNGKPLWFSISLIGRYQGPTAINPLRLTGSAGYVPSHTYRLLVYGQVTLANGRSAATTLCSGDCTGAPTLTIGPSYTYVGQPPSSVPLTGIPCWVGQAGLVFTLVNNTYVIEYSGWSGCVGGSNLGRRSLTVCVQVGNWIKGRAMWFTVSGSCLSGGPTMANPLNVSTARTAFLGHGYRIVASSTVQYPTSHGTVTRSGMVYSAASGP